MSGFSFQTLFELGHHEDTPWRKLTGDFVGTAKLAGRDGLTVDVQGLTQLASAAIRDVSHLFRPGHLQQVRNVIDDPEASPNDRFVALQMLKNANV